MSDFILIQHIHPPHDHVHQGPHRHVALRAPRTTLAKRRWRGTAQDGKEFGFDLEEPMRHGTEFYHDNATCYFLEQFPEPLLEIPVSTVETAAKIAWNIGNLHFTVQIQPDSIRVLEDSAITQFLQREGIHFYKSEAVFLPLSTASGHHPHEHHHV